MIRGEYVNCTSEFKSMGRISSNFYFKNNISGKTDEEKTEILREVIEEFQKLQLPPDRLYLFDNLVVEAEWGFKEDVMVKEEDLEVLIQNFERYLNTIEFMKGVFNSGNLSDDPNEIEEDLEVTRKIFGIRNYVKEADIDYDNLPKVEKDIEILDLRENPSENLTKYWENTI